MTDTQEGTSNNDTEKQKNNDLNNRIARAIFKQSEQKGIKEKEKGSCVVIFGRSPKLPIACAFHEYNGKKWSSFPKKLQKKSI